jgi:aspartate kinase
LSETAGLFAVETENGLTLVTVRHYQPEILQSLLKEREMVLQQWSRETVQTLVR